MTQFRPTVTFVFCLASVLIPAAQASLVATYTFNNTLAAQQTGVAALTAVDPLGTSGFQTATVFGNLQTTYQFNGAATPVLDQGGLDFDTTGLISSDDYSVEMVVELTGSTGWRRLLDASDGGGIELDFPATARRELTVEEVARVTAVILHGRNMMPALGNTLSDQELADLMAYLHTL